MLAGVGPVPAALLVVAADDGWIGADRRAPRRPRRARRAARAARGDQGRPRRPRRRCWPTSASGWPATSMGGVAGVAVSAPHRRRPARADRGARAAARRAARARPGRAVRLWVDRALHHPGRRHRGHRHAGRRQRRASATGCALGDRRGRASGACSRSGEPVERATATARVALNLRGVAVEELARGDALLTPGAFRPHRGASTSR